MLLGGTMLAACSVDDDLNLSPVAQEANPSAPVFTVSLDNGSDPLTRASWVGGKSQKVTFDSNDVLSLYHGVAITEDPDNPWYESFGGYRNAIYQAEGDGDGLKFVTKAMVEEGGAILIYPADTTDTWYKGRNEAPYITIKDVQTEKTKLNNPYMSEVLTIGEYDKTAGSDVAGYDKKYDIVLKRVGSTLDLTLNLLPNEDIEQLELENAIGVTKVELKDTDEDGNTPFTTSIQVKATGDAAVAYVAATSTKAGAHTTWKNQSDLDTDATATTDNTVSSISTVAIAKDANGNDVASFTLLPMLKDQALKSGEVKVYTNYGSVTLTDPANKTELDDKEKIWSRQVSETEVEKTGITAGLQQVLSNENCLWKPMNVKTSVFYNKANPEQSEKSGYYIPRTVVVDMTNLDMDGLHIKNESQLIDVKKVLEVVGIKRGKTSTFHLDGTEGKFTISDPKAYEAYKFIATYDEQFDDNTTKLEMVLCQDEGEECEVVVLDKAANADGVVPTVLKFGRLDGQKINVELAGKGWTLKGSKTFVNVDSLVVSNGAEVALEDTINVKNPAYIEGETPNVKKYVATTALVNRPEGKITVNDDVILQMNTRNYGTIEVGDDNAKAGTNDVRLRMSGLDVAGLEGTTVNTYLTLVNDIYVSELNYEKAYDKDLKYTTDEAGRGKIYLYNRLATVDDTKARIYNFGYIEIKGSDNGQGSVLLFANSTSTNSKGEDGLPSFSKPFKNEKWGKDNLTALHSGDNIFGVVKFRSTTNPLSNIISNAKGFGKFVSNNFIADTGLVNYVITSATSLGATKPSYLELVNDGQLVQVGAASVAISGALIVPSSVTVSIPVGNGLKVDNIYLKGEIYRAGTFGKNSSTVSAVNYETYVGGDKNDQYKVTSAGDSDK